MLISDLSSRFIHLPPDMVDQEIEVALGRVCTFLDIDLAVLWQWSDKNPGVIAPTHVHLALGGPRPVDPMHEAQYPWSRQQMLDGHTIVVTSPEDLPAEAETDRETCRLFGIKSVLCLPLAVGGEPPVGALGFNALREARDWPEPMVRRLQLVTQVFTNALARRRRELSLQEGELRLGLAIDSAEAGLWSFDYSTGVFWTAARTRDIFGFSQDEVVDLARLKALVHPNDWEQVRNALERSEHGGDPVKLEYRIILPGDRRTRWIASSGRLKLKPSGLPECLVGLSIDITERRREQEALRLSQARLAAGADLAGLAFYEVDLRTGLTFADDRMRDLCGIPPERGQGFEALTFWMEQLHPEDRTSVLDNRQRLHEGSFEHLSMEYRYLHPTRGERWLHHIGRVTRRDAAGSAIRTFGVLRDITEPRRAEETLRESYAEIQRLKDRLQAESDYLKAEIHLSYKHSEIIGQAPLLKKVLREVEQVAPTDASVLVCGETGTGKELVAQAIHRQSRRKNHLMVKVNCAALPTGLLESELFGREKGAYTGALTRQIGRFEIADGSTLFLDEIGELSLDMQAKLLRVLETGEFERLGNPKSLKVDVRIIAATNRDLVEEIRKGRFREDLYYRINVFPLRVPPLRARAEDIPMLVWAFLEKFSARMGKKITQVPRKTMDELQRHPWPGNIRELRNVIERGAIITSGDTLRIPALEGMLEEAMPSVSLADADREHILRAIERSHGHIKGPKGAAAGLGLNPATLYSRMKKLGIPPGRGTEGEG